MDECNEEETGINWEQPNLRANWYFIGKEKNWCEMGVQSKDESLRWVDYIQD